jgi:hypothetical protein
VIDLVDREAVLRLENTYRQQAAARGSSRALAEIEQLRCQRTVTRHAATGRVGDPVVGRAVNGANLLITDHKSPNIAPRFVHVLLNIENLMVHTERDFMPDHHFGHFAAIDTCQ